MGTRLAGQHFDMDVPSLTVSGAATIAGNVNGARFLAGADTAAAPGFSWQAETTKGLYSNAVGGIGTSVASGNVFAYSAAVNTNNSPFANTSSEFNTADITPTQLTANTDNWAPTGFATCRRVRASSDAARNLTGIAGGSDGFSVRLFNIGAFAITLVHDATSTAANRFLCPNSANVTLRPNGFVDLDYDATSSRWRVSGA